MADEGPAAFAAPWRLEIFDDDDLGLGGAYAREALAVEGRPVYAGKSGHRLTWSGSWRLLSPEGTVEMVLREAVDSPQLGSTWTKPRGKKALGLFCVTAPAQRIRLSGPQAGVFQLQKARHNGRPLYRRQEQEACLENDRESQDTTICFETGQTSKRRHSTGAQSTSGWVVRCEGTSGTILRELGDAVLPDGLADVEVVDTRARDPQKHTHDPVTRAAADVVEDFCEEDQPTDGVDNIQDARAVTSVVRKWHVSRFNWAVEVGKGKFSQLRAGDQEFHVEPRLFSDAHCDFCGRQRRLFLVRAFRKASKCPLSCESCKELGLNGKPKGAAREMMHELFWACHKCTQYLLGAPAARLHEKPEKKDQVDAAAEEGGRPRREIVARSADEDMLQERSAGSAQEGALVALPLPSFGAGRFVEARAEAGGAASSAGPARAPAEDSDDESESEAPAGPPCSCGMLTKRHKVKQGGNIGKAYFKCRGWPDFDCCDFFLWEPDPSAPLCMCNQRAVRVTATKEGPNHGKDFFACPKPRGAQCPKSFIGWADEASSGSAGPESSRRCCCGAAAVRLQVKKEGPNTGRWFYKCSKPQHEQPPRCQKFFEWDDGQGSGLNGPSGGAPSASSGLSAPSGPGAPGAQSGPGGSGGSSWTAGQTHGEQSAQGMAASPRRSSTGGDICFKCNQPGHWAKNCPSTKRRYS